MREDDDVDLPGFAVDHALNDRRSLPNQARKSVYTQDKIRPIRLAVITVV